MSHVDEGALHAYLDGALDEFPAADAERIRAHLEQCAECARRLQVEREVRTDAHAMLELADPAVEMPSLEELRAYVKRTRPDGSTAVRRLRRMGWAASIVIAVGVGWMLRDGQLQQEGLVQRGELQRPTSSVASTRESGANEAPNAPAGISVDAASADEPALRPDASDELRNAQEKVDAPRREDEARVRVAEGLPVATQESGSEGESDAEVQPGADVQADTEGDSAAEVDSGAEGRRAARPNVAEPGAAPTVERLPADITASATAGSMGADTTDPEALDSLEEAMRPPGETVVVVADVADSAPADDSADGAAGRSRAVPPAPVVSALYLSGSVASREAGNEERAEAGEPPLAVPGLEVLSVTSLGEGTAAYGVHVVQRLQGNNLLDVFHLEPGVDAAMLPPIGEGTREVRLETGARWLVLRGPLDVADLEALMDRISPR